MDLAECEHDMDDCKCCEIVSCIKCHRTDNELALIDLFVLKARNYLADVDLCGETWRTLK